MERRRVTMNSVIGPPDTYDAELEYIQVTGTQFIKLPIKPSEITDAVEVKFHITTSETTQYAAIIQTDSDSDWVFRIDTQGNNALSYHTDSSRKNLYGSKQPGVGKILHTVRLDFKNQNTIFDGAIFPFPVSLRRVSNNYFTLFRKTSINRVCTVNIYYCKYWRNGILMFDLIPVRKNGVGYMYDKVHRKLYGNAGTGDFVIGYDELTNLSDFTSLNYIYQDNRNSSPRAGIYTGIVSRPDKIKIELDITRHKNLSGTHGTDSGPIVGWNSSYVFTDNCGSLSGTTAVSGTRYTVTMDDYQNTDVSPSNVSVICLMGRYRTGDSRGNATVNDAVCAKLHGAKIWVNDVLERNYVPVQHPSGQRGLFDKVYNKFYPSCTTYNFLGA